MLLLPNNKLLGGASSNVIIKLVVVSRRVYTGLIVKAVVHYARVVTKIFLTKFGYLVGARLSPIF
jgi:hypothetical protein